LTTFFADTPGTLCAFPTSTKYATRFRREIVENALAAGASRSRC
jgi:hypothetical protein